jgi:uncharacterized protein (DUF433 family)
MSTTVNVKLTDEQMTWLEQEAKRLGASSMEIVASRIEEARREDEFPWVEFREAFQGRDAFLRGTRLKVWLLINHVRDNNGDVAKTARELDVPEVAVANAVEYAATYVAEIDAAIAENDAAADALQAELATASTIPVNASHP